MVGDTPRTEVSRRSHSYMLLRTPYEGTHSYCPPPYEGLTRAVLLRTKVLSRTLLRMFCESISLIRYPHDYSCSVLCTNRRLLQIPPSSLIRYYFWHLFVPNDPKSPFANPAVSAPLSLQWDLEIGSSGDALVRAGQL